MFGGSKIMLYICGMENTLTQTLTLELTPEELETLSQLWFYDVDTLQYEVEMITKYNDPNGELEELTNLMLSAMEIQKKLNDLNNSLHGWWCSQSLSFFSSYVVPLFG